MCVCVVRARACVCVCVCVYRLNELQVVKSKLNESDTERQRQARELEDLQNKLQWLTKINKQVSQCKGWRVLCTVRGFTKTHTHTHHGQPPASRV